MAKIDYEEEYDLVVPNSEADETPPKDEAAPAPKAKEAEDEVELEIVDDTPEEDRGRTPMPKPLLEELEADELDAYDGKVKERLKQMRKVWHDERREKEALQREQAAALEYLKRVRGENERLRSTLTMGSKEYATILKQAATHELALAKHAYKAAYEAGDSDKMVEAQAAMQTAQLKIVQADNFRVPTLQEPTNEVKTTQEPTPRPVQRQPAPEPALDPKLSAWQERNSWYGTDDEMTAAALGRHEKLRREGTVQIGSDEYYADLDKTMRRRFPEYFGAQAEKKETKPSTVVAPAVRSSAPKRIRLTSSQVALAKKLGITPEQYAREVRKMESGHE